LRERDPAAYQRRAFELSVAGYFRGFPRLEESDGVPVNARTRAVWIAWASNDLVRVSETTRRDSQFSLP